MGDLVSVIVPVFRAEKYIRKCLDSILNQTYENLEVVLVNDGSDDDSGKICDEYKSLDSRVKAFHISNSGVSNARNFGIENCEGKWITFVDADDYILENHIENLVGTVATDGVDIGVVNLKYITEDEKIITDNLILPERSGLFTREQALDDMGKGVSIWGYSWTKLFSRDLLLSEDIRFDANVKVWEDMLFCAKALSKMKMAMFCDIATYIYVRHSDTAVTSSSYDLKKTKYTAMLKMEELVKNLLNEGVLKEDSRYTGWTRGVLAKTCLDDITAQIRSGNYDRELVNERLRKAAEYRGYLNFKNRMKMLILATCPHSVVSVLIKNKS